MGLTRVGLSHRVVYMSTKTQTGIQAIIDELHRSAARNIALAVDSEARFPWREHDVRIYKERAQKDIDAAALLIEEA